MPNHAKTVPKGCLHVCKKLVKKAIFKRARVGGPPVIIGLITVQLKLHLPTGTELGNKYEVLKDAYMERLKFNETVSENIWPLILK